MASDSGQSRSESSSSSGDQHKNSSSLNVLKTRDWLKSQLHDYKSDATAGADQSLDTLDVLQLSARIKTLQEELFLKSLDRDKKELLGRRVQLGHILREYLFPNDDEEGDTLEKAKRGRHLEQLVDKQYALVSQIMKIHEEMETDRPALECLKKENFELRIKSRELIASVRERRELIQESAKKFANDKITKRNYGYFNSTLEKIAIKRNTLQALVLGSGINWMTNPDQKNLVLALGEPLNF